MKARMLLLILIAGTSACTTTPNVHTDADPAANFAGYRTYNWVYTQVPQGMNPLMYERVRAAIDRSLAARSYTQGNPGDFAIAFTLGARDRVEVTDFGPYGPGFRPYGWGGWGAYRNVDVRNVTDGTLAIDIYDVATKKPVWHGVATQEVSSSDLDSAKIQAAVDAVIAKFPPQPGS